MKKGILSFMCLLACLLLSAQNIIVQQNNSVQQQQEPKVVYKDRVVYVEKQSQGPILVAGYLWVYPDKIGYYDKCPTAIINGINKRRAYGKSTWRLPTSEEARLLFASYPQLDLKKYGYSRDCWTIWTQETKDVDFSYIDDDRIGDRLSGTVFVILVCDD